LTVEPLVLVLVGLLLTLLILLVEVNPFGGSTADLAADDVVVGFALEVREAERELDFCLGAEAHSFLQES